MSQQPDRIDQPFEIELTAMAHGGSALGRHEGRTIFVLACGSEKELPTGFEVPFQNTAAYLDMHYGGAFYAQVAKGAIPLSVGVAAAAFGATVFAAGGHVK